MTDEKVTDAGIIKLFFARTEKAIGMLAEKYGRLAFSLSYNITGSREDAEECVSDALLAVWNSIPPRRPTSLSAYFCSLVRNISYDKYDYNHAEKRNGETNAVLDELSEVLSLPYEENEEERRLIRDTVNAFLRDEKKENRILFVRRYFYSVPLCELAKESGEGTGALAMRLSRMRERLKARLSEEGINV